MVAPIEIPDSTSTSPSTANLPGTIPGGTAPSGEGSLFIPGTAGGGLPGDLSDPFAAGGLPDAFGENVPVSPGDLIQAPEIPTTPGGFFGGGAGSNFDDAGQVGLRQFLPGAFSGLSQNAGPLTLRGNALGLGDAPISTGDLSDRISFAPGTVGEADQEVISNFLNPQLSKDQRRILSGFGKLAFGRGLVGGAVNAQLENLNTRLLARRRSSAAISLGAAGGRRIDSINATISPFLQSIAEQEQAFLASGAAGISPGFASAQTGRRLFGPLAQAFKGLGLGEELFAGIAEGANVGLKKSGFEINNAQVRKDIQLFLDPQLAGGKALGRQKFGDSLTEGSEKPNAALFAQLATVRRLAGQRLSTFIQGQTAQLREGTGALQSIGLASGVLAGTSLSGAQEVLGQDVSPFQDVLKRLGFTRQPQQINDNPFLGIGGSKGIFTPQDIFGGF